VSGLSPGVRIDLVEDQAFTRGLTVQRLAEIAGPAARVRGFASVEGLLEAGDRGDVVVLDLQLEGGGVEGDAAIELLARDGPPVVVLSGLHSGEALARAQAAGARAYVGKDAGGIDDLVVAIAEVLAGRDHVDAKLLEGIRQTAHKTLTARQQEVLRLEAMGFKAAAIAQALEPRLTVPGVRRHIEAIVEVYPECAKQANRVRLAIALGVVTPWEVHGSRHRPTT
jgi:DNA-binding NarL/FixJ family response regulator